VIAEATVGVSESEGALMEKAEPRAVVLKNLKGNTWSANILWFGPFKEGYHEIADRMVEYGYHLETMDVWVKYAE
jgi:hypothetical protein